MLVALERAGVVAFIAKEASPTCGLAKARVGIRSFMWKTYVHAKKKGRLEGVDLNELTVDSPEVRTNVDSLARELVGLGRISFENDLLFGTSPVIRRDGYRVAARESAASSSPIAPPH